jgi:hypothetical protein
MYHSFEREVMPSSYLGRSNLAWVVWWWCFEGIIDLEVDRAHRPLISSYPSYLQPEMITDIKSNPNEISMRMKEKVYDN